MNILFVDKRYPTFGGISAVVSMLAKQFVADGHKVYVATLMPGLYEGIEELTYYYAYKDMLFVEGVLYSPLGVKKFFVHNIFARNKNIDCMMSPSKTKAYEKYDILNLQHSRWFNCVSGAERRESFFDLVDKAREELLTVDTIIRKSYRGDNVKRDITKFVDNIDHDGFEVGAKKLHYQVFSDLRDTK